MGQKSSLSGMQKEPPIFRIQLHDQITYAKAYKTNSSNEANSQF